MKKLAKKLMNLKDNDNLKDYVIDYILKYYKTNEEIENLFKDLSHGGCQNGTINTLIYYNQTQEFFNKFQDEIFELVDELEEEYGEPLKIKSPKSNYYAWLGFEETAYRIASEIGVEI